MTEKQMTHDDYEKAISTLRDAVKAGKIGPSVKMQADMIDILLIVAEEMYREQVSPWGLSSESCDVARHMNNVLHCSTSLEDAVYEFNQDLENVERKRNDLRKAYQNGQSWAKYCL